MNTIRHWRRLSAFLTGAALLSGAGLAPTHPAAAAPATATDCAPVGHVIPPTSSGAITAMASPARGDVCVVLQATNAYGNIYPLGDKVREALTEIRRYVELWVLTGKSEQRGKHVPSPKGRRKLDAHTPYGFLMACSEEALRLIELTEHAEATC